MVLIVVVLVLLGMPLWVLLHAAMLRVLLRWVDDVQMGWPGALVTAAVAFFAQGCASGVLAGGDGGCLGTLVGWAAWTAMVSLLADISFGKGMVVAVAMAVMQWVLMLAAVGVGLVVGLGAALGSALAVGAV